MGEERSLSEEKREFVRIEDVVPLEVRAVDPARRGTVRAREIIAPAPVERQLIDGCESEESRVLRYLAAVNAKLDLLIHHLVAREENLDGLEQRRVNLSASGIQFPMDEAPEPGALLELKLMLPGAAPVAVCLYAEVTRVEGDSAPYSVAGRFVAMNEEIQEHIMRYIFNRQREEIRRRRECR